MDTTKLKQTGPTGLIVFSVLVLTIALAAVNLNGSAGGAAVADTDAVFVKAASAPLYPPMWAIDTGQVEMPDGVTFQKVSSLTQSVQMAADGSSDTGSASLLKIGYIVEKNPDFQLTGHALNANSSYFTLYTRANSSISGPADLEGERVALPLSSSIGVVGAMALEDAGVDMSTVTLVDKPFSAMKPLLQSGDVAAAMVPGTHSDLAVVMQPKRYWEEKYGADAPTGLWYVDGDASVAAATGAATAYNESINVGFSQLPTVVADYKQETGKNLSTVFHAIKGTQVITLEDADWAALQEVVDYAYQHNYTDRQVNLTALRVDSE